MADVNINIKVNDSGAAQKIDRLASATKRVDSRVNRLNSTLNKTSIALGVFAGNVAAIGFSKLVSGIAELGSSSLKVTGELETLRTQFEVLTGSAGAANKAVQDLQQFAANTPFQFKDLARAQQRLLSFGFSLEESKDNLVDLGDVSAASGADIGELALIFGQVQAAGKLTGERLLQLQERAIPIGPAIAKTLGVAESSVRDLVAKGKVSFKDFETAFKSLNDVGQFAFEGTIKRSRTLEGRLSTLSDNFQLLQANIGQKLAPAFKAILTTVTLFIQRIQQTSAFNGFLTTIGNNIPAAISFAIDSFSFLINSVLNAVKIFNLFRSGVTSALSTVIGAFTKFIDIYASVINALGLGDTAIGRSINSIKSFRDDVTSSLDATAQGFAKSAAEIDASQKTVNETINKGKQYILQAYAEEKTAAEEQANAIVRENQKKAESAINTVAVETEELRKLRQAQDEYTKFLQEEQWKREEALKESQLAIKMAEEEDRLARQGDNKIFTDQRLIDLQNYYTAEEEAQIQAKINAAATEIEKQTLINNAVANGIKKRRQMQEVENKFLLQGAAGVFGGLADIAKAGGKKNFEIAKSFSLAEATIRGILAVQQAISTPPGPPITIPLGIAAGVQAAARIAQIQATSPSFQQGGIVPGTSFTGDKVTANVNSGEMILNRQQQAQLFNLANGQSLNNPSQIIVNTKVQLNEETIAEAVSRQVANGLILGEVQ